LFQLAHRTSRGQQYRQRIADHPVVYHLSRLQSRGNSPEVMARCGDLETVRDVGFEPV
jgi:hypothetical protein